MRTARCHDTALETSTSIHIVGQNGIVYVPAEDGYSAIDANDMDPKMDR